MTVIISRMFLELCKEENGEPIWKKSVREAIQSVGSVSYDETQFLVVVSRMLDISIDYAERVLFLLEKWGLVKLEDEMVIPVIDTANK